MQSHEIDSIIAALDEVASAERAAKSDSIYPTRMKVLGVSNPDLKMLVNEMYNLNRKADRDYFMQLARDLVDTRIIECQMFAWLLLEKARIVKTINPGELTGIQGVLDNWVSVDTYGVTIYGVLWNLGNITDHEVLTLQGSENFWERRLALVATVALNLKSRGGSGDSIRTLKLCEGAVMDHEDMVVKALSWALRSLIRWDKSAVEAFMEKHESKLHRRVVREVNHKLIHGTKN